MTVELTDEQYGAIARALVFIAAGKRFVPGGKQKNIPKSEMIQRAREAAAAIRLSYLGDGGGTSSFPGEIGLEHRPRRAPAPSAPLK